MYEQLVIGKHQMHRIFVSNENVKRRFLERHKNSEWGEDEERDNIDYLEQELQIWKEQFPLTAAKMLKEEEDEENNKQENNSNNYEKDMEEMMVEEEDEEGRIEYGSTGSAKNNEEESESKSGYSPASSNSSHHNVDINEQATHS